MKKNYLILLILCGVFSANAQFSLKGKITDSEGIPLAGANIQLSNTFKGTVTNNNGFYAIEKLNSGEYNIMVSFIGYEKLSVQVIINQDTEQNLQLKAKTFVAQEIVVQGIRATEKTPVTFSIVNKEALEAKNLGQDLPYMLAMEPSLITTSDAGAGVGYTGLWIRGSNTQRINVTVNGVPINDPESHGVFWVNMPDFTSSVNNAQVQRGVGTSTNGGGAFGATINLETEPVESEPYAEINSAAGSFNTFKNNIKFGSGLIKDHWNFEGRLSKITSDGYIDRASSDLQSFFIQGAYYAPKTTIKALVFGGKEKTYQAWYGTDAWTMENYGRTFNWAGYIENNDGSYSFYDNQTDNYKQNHYQLHWSQKILPQLKFNASLHYTYGSGYYEEYYQNEPLADYPIGNQYFGIDSLDNGLGGYNYFYHDSVIESDMVVQRWLDNHFYGTTFSIDYSIKNFSMVLGGAYNKYDPAKHYGEIIWSQYAGDTKPGEKFYESTSDKTDFNSYLKGNYTWGSFDVFADLQMRKIAYKSNGTDKGGAIVNIDENYLFFNPKVGLTYAFENFGDIYTSYAIANREPIRTDFLDAPNGTKPEPEKLTDIELGWRKNKETFFYNANVYLMNYDNQLALTGELNDVGYPIRANIGKSYRMGIELDAGIKPLSWLSVRANLALSNSNTDYKEERYDTEGNIEIIDHNNVQVSYSPKTVAGSEFIFYPISKGEIGITTRFISKQYLDLTQNNDKMLEAYSFTNLSLAYTLNPKLLEEIKITLLANNVFNKMYASNGYVWGETPYYYPQAGTNFIVGITLRF